MADCAKPYYCYDIESYPSDTSCDNKEFYLSGISAIGLVACGITITDPSDETEIAGLIADGSLTIIKAIKAGFDEPSALTIDPVTSCGSTITVNYDRSITFSDAKVSTGIVEWYNDAKRQSYGGALIYECGENRVSYINAAVQMTAARAGENTNATAQTINGTITWRGFDDPVPVEAPAGIFT